MLAVQIIDGRQYVSRTDATLWLSRKCPTGENVKSWIALQTAANLYLFTVSELEDYIADKTLQSKIGAHGDSRGTLYVSKHQCGQLRQRIGFKPEEAARRVGVTVERCEKLLDGEDWCTAKTTPHATV